MWIKQFRHVTVAETNIMHLATGTQKTIQIGSTFLVCK